MTDLPPGRQAYIQDLTRERFTKSVWFETSTPAVVDSKLMQGIRRRALSEALDGLQDEEVEAV